MEKFMEFIVLYGFGLGLLLAIIIMFIFVRKTKKFDGRKEVTTYLLPFIAGTSLFAATGGSVAIQNIYRNKIGSENFFVGIGFCIPLVIALVIYVISYIIEIKKIKVDEYNKKCDKW